MLLQHRARFIVEGREMFGTGKAMTRDELSARLDDIACDQARASKDAVLAVADEVLALAGNPVEGHAILSALVRMALSIKYDVDEYVIRCEESAHEYYCSSDSLEEERSDMRSALTDAINALQEARRNI